MMAGSLQLAERKERADKCMGMQVGVRCYIVSHDTLAWGMGLLRMYKLASG